MSYIKEDENSTWCGEHWLIEIWNPYPERWKDDAKFIQLLLGLAAGWSQATILHNYFHTFDNGGISGVVVLAESHISFHSWPEEKYIAIDVFMCGDCDPKYAAEFLEGFYGKQNMTITKHKRGLKNKPNKTLD